MWVCSKQCSVWRWVRGLTGGNNLQDGTDNHCIGVVSGKGVHGGPHGYPTNVLPRNVHEDGQHGGMCPHGVGHDTRGQKNMRESVAFLNAMGDPLREVL